MAFKKGENTGSKNNRWIGGQLTRFCLLCKKTFKTYPSQNGRFCSKKCGNTFRRGKPSGKNNHRFVNCGICNKQFQLPISQITKNNYCSLECEYRARIGRYAGKDNHFWRGGVTPLKNQIRSLWEYVNWRNTIFNRDNYTCQSCGYRGKGLNVDHYPISFAQIFNVCKIITLEQARGCLLLWDINNGRTLCKPCHKLTSTYLKPLEIFSTMS